MNKYLFRGVRADGEGWVYGYYVILKNHNSIDYIESYQIILNNGHSYEVIPETVGQWTGLKDKNDVKIFEGDRVKIENEAESGIIEYSGSSFIISCCHGCYFDWMESEVEVIGNIHGGKFEA